MKLPIPVFMPSGNIFTEVEIVRPKAIVIADAKKFIDSGMVMSAVKSFLSGCIESIKSDERVISDKTDIKNMVGFIPYRSAEFCMIQIMILYDPDNDGAEGVYRCPRCGFRIVNEFVKEGEMEIDTRDFISQLETTFMEEIVPNFTVSLSQPVNIINQSTKDVLLSVESMTLRHPTLNDCMVAERKYGSNDSVRMQFAMYVEAMEKINGMEVEKKDKSLYGILIFENIKDARVDLGALNTEVSKYGINPNVDKVCPSCDKKFRVPINLSNFFVSGLTL